MITETEQKERLEKAIQQMADDPDIIQIVKAIQGEMIPTTKGHYGRYMVVLLPFARDRVSLFVVTRAMLRLGADPYGIQWAVKLLS
jgi:hypothetical protein